MRIHSLMHFPPIFMPAGIPRLFGTRQSSLLSSLYGIATLALLITIPLALSAWPLAIISGLVALASGISAIIISVKKKRKNSAPPRNSDTPSEPIRTFVADHSSCLHFTFGQTKGSVATVSGSKSDNQPEAERLTVSPSP